MPRQTSVLSLDLRCKVTKASARHPSPSSPTSPHKTQWVPLHPNLPSLLLAQLRADNIQNRPLSRRGYHPQPRNHRKHHKLLQPLRHPRAKLLDLPYRVQNTTPRNNRLVQGQAVCAPPNTSRLQEREGFPGKSPFSVHASFKYPPLMFYSSSNRPRRTRPRLRRLPPAHRPRQPPSNLLQL